MEDPGRHFSKCGRKMENAAGGQEETIRRTIQQKNSEKKTKFSGRWGKNLFKMWKEKIKKNANAMIGSWLPGEKPFET